ncbi:hypothetical protein ACFPYI_05440 [Halomarina salina]|uniref:Uncharacterized protein n=1 Tax=Halomarina salina TaxID=1872699 RepID=A0ABD5RJR6_9EURY|nr:hypothetical protein [Halomarina salina]
MGKSLAAVALVACLLLSGCSGVLPASEETSTPDVGVESDVTATATLDGPTTDSSATTAPSTPDSEEAAPAFEDGRLANTSSLVVSHRRATNGTGFSFESSAVTRAQDAAVPVNYMNRTVRVGAGGTSYVAEYNQTGGLSTDRQTARWSNGTFGASREVRSVAFQDDAVQYLSGPIDSVETPLSLSGFVPMYLRAGSFAVESTAGDGTRTLVASETHNGTLGTYEVRAFEATATVDAVGRVRSLSVDTTLVIENITFDQRYRFALSTDPAAVERPSWVETAVEKTPRVDAHVEDDYVVVTNTGSVELGPRVALMQGNSGASAALDDSLAPGETVYLYRATGDAYRLVVSDSPPTERRESLSGQYEVRFSGRGYFEQVSVPVNAGEE